MKDVDVVEQTAGVEVDEKVDAVQDAASDGADDRVGVVTEEELEDVEEVLEVVLINAEEQ